MQAIETENRLSDKFMEKFTSSSAFEKTSKKDLAVNMEFFLSFRSEEL